METETNIPEDASTKAFGIHDVTRNSSKENEHKAEPQYEAHNQESQVINNQNLEGWNTETNATNYTEEHEKGSVSHKEDKLPIKDDVKLIEAEAGDMQEATNIQLLKIATESVPKDEPQSELPILAIVKGESEEILQQQILQEHESAVTENGKSSSQENEVEQTADVVEEIDPPETTAQVDTQKEEHDDHQSEASSKESMARKHNNAEGKVTSESSTKSSNDVDELEKQLFENSEVRDDSKNAPEEATDIKELIDVRTQKSETAREPEDQILQPLPSTASVGVEAVDQSIQKEIYTEAEIPVKDATGEQIPEEDSEEQEAVTKAYGLHELTYQTSSENELRTGPQSEVQNLETTIIKHSNLEGETKELDPTEDTKEHEMVQASHSKEKLEIDNDGKWIQEEANEMEETTEMQLLKTTSESVHEDKALQTLPHAISASVEAVDEITQGEMHRKAELVRDTEEGQIQGNDFKEKEEVSKEFGLNEVTCRTNAEDEQKALPQSEAQNEEITFMKLPNFNQQAAEIHPTEDTDEQELPVSHHQEKLEINDDGKLIQETATEMEEATETLLLKTKSESVPEDAAQSTVPASASVIKGETEEILMQKTLHEGESAATDINKSSRQENEQKKTANVVEDIDEPETINQVSVETKQQADRQALSMQSVIPNHVNGDETLTSESNIKSSNDADELEKLPKSHSVENSEIKDGIQPEEATEIIDVTEVEIQKSETESVQEEVALPTLLINVDEVQSSTQEEIHTETDHQPEAPTMIPKHVNAEQTLTSEISIKSSHDVEDVNKIPESHSVENSEIKNGSKAEEAAEIKDVTEVEIQKNETESLQENNTLHTSPNAEAMKVEAVQTSIQEEIYTEVEHQQEASSIQAVIPKHVNAEETLTSESSIKSSYDANEVEKIPESHSVENSEVKEGNQLEEATKIEDTTEVETEQSETEGVQEDIALPTLLNTESISAEVVKLSTQDEIHTKADYQPEEPSMQSITPKHVNAEETLTSESSIKSTYDVNEVEKIPESQSVENSEIENGSQAEEATEIKDVTELEIQKNETEGVQEDIARPTLPNTESISVEAVQSSTHVEIHTEADYQPEEPSVQSVTPKHVNAEETLTSESSIKSSYDVDEVEKIPESHSVENSLIENGSQAEEAAEIKDVTEVEMQKNETEGVKENNTSPNTESIRVEAVQTSIQKEIHTEAEHQPEAPSVQSVIPKHVSAEETLTSESSTKSSYDVNEAEKIPEAHSIENSEVKDGNQPEEATKIKDTTEMKIEQSTIEGVQEDIAQPTLSNTESISVEAIQSSTQDEIHTEADYQPEEPSMQSVTPKHANAEETLTSESRIKSSYDVDEVEKIPESHSVENSQIENGSQAEEAAEIKDVTEVEIQKNETEGVEEDTALPTLPNTNSFSVEAVQSSTQDAIQTEVGHQPEAPSMQSVIPKHVNAEETPTSKSSIKSSYDVDEVEKIPESHSVENAEIKNGSQAEEAAEINYVTEVELQKNESEDLQENNALHTLPNTESIKGEAVQTSIQEEINTKAEHQPEAPSAKSVISKHVNVEETLTSKSSMNEVEKTLESYSDENSEVKDGNQPEEATKIEDTTEVEIKQSETEGVRVLEDIAQPTLPNTESIIVEAVQSRTQDKIHTETDYQPEEPSMQSVTPKHVNAEETLTSERSTKSSYDLDEVEKIPESHSDENSEIKNGSQEEEAAELKDLTEVELQKNESEGVQEEVALQTLPNNVEAVQSRTQEEIHTESGHQPEAPSMQSMVPKHVNEEETLTSESSLKSSNDVDEVEKISESNSVETSEIKNGSQAEEAAEIKDVPEVEIQKNEAESVRVQEDIALPTLPNTEPISVEAVQSSTQDEIHTEADYQPEEPRMQSMTLKHVNVEETLTTKSSIKSSYDVDKVEKIPESNSVENSEIKNGSQAEEAAEIKDVTEVELQKNESESGQEDISLQPLPNTDSFSVEAVQSTTQDEIHSEVGYQPEAPSMQSVIPKRLNAEETLTSESSIKSSYDVDEVEKILESHSVENSEIKNGSQAKEEAEIEDVTELMKQKNETEGVQEDIALPSLPNTDSFRVEAVQSSTQEGIHTEAGHQPEAPSMQSVIPKHANEEETLTSESSLKSCYDVDDVETIPESHSAKTSEIKNGSQAEEAAGIKDVTEVEIQQNERESVQEDIAPPTLPNTESISVEAVPTSIQEEIYTEANHQPETPSMIPKHVNAEETQTSETSIKSSYDVDKVEKIPESHYVENSEVKDGNQPEEATKIEDTTGVKIEQSETEGVQENIPLPTLPNMESISVEELQTSIQEEIHTEAELPVTDTKEEQIPEKDFEKKQIVLEEFDLCDVIPQSIVENELKAQAQNKETMLIEHPILERESKVGTEDEGQADRQSEATSMQSLITKDTSAGGHEKLESITKSSDDGDELQKIPESHSVENSEVKDDNKIAPGEASDINESTDGHTQISEIDHGISSPNTESISVEVVETSTQEETHMEAELPVSDAKEGQIPENEIEKKEKPLEALDPHEVMPPTNVENELKAEPKSEAQNQETTFIEHPILEGESVDINANHGIEEQEKAPALHTGGGEKLEKKDDGEFTQDEAKEREEASKERSTEIVANSMPEDDSQPTFPTLATVQVETEEILQQQTIDEDESTALDNENSCKQKNQFEKTVHVVEALHQAETMANVGMENEGQAGHQSEVPSMPSVITKHINVEGNETLESYTKSSNDVNELEKIPEPPSVDNLQVKDDTKITPEEATDINESTGGHRQIYETESVPEDTCLQTLHNTAYVGVEEVDQGITSLHAESISVEAVETSIQEQIPMEAESPKTDTKEGLIPENDLEQEQTALEAFDLHEGIPQTEIESNLKAEPQSESQKQETTFIEHPILERESIDINPNDAIGRQEKVPATHTRGREKLEQKDDGKIIQDKAKQGDETSKMRSTETAANGVPEDEEQPMLPTLASVKYETEEILQQQTTEEDESAAIDNYKSCGQKNELEKTADVEALHQAKTMVDIGMENEGKGEHQLEAPSKQSAIKKHNIVGNETSESSAESSNDVNELEKIPEPNSVMSSEVKDDNKITPEEATDIDELAGGVLQMSENESMPEDTCLQTLANTTYVGIEAIDKGITLPNTESISVDAVETSIQEEIHTEALPVTDNKEGQIPEYDFEKKQKDIEAFDLHEVMPQTKVENEQKVEPQYEAQNQETTFTKHTILEGVSIEVNPNNVTEEHDKVPASQTGGGEKLEKRDDEKFIANEAKEMEEASQIKTAVDSVPEDEAQETLPNTASASDEAVDKSIQEEMHTEATPEVTDIVERQIPENYFQEKKKDSEEFCLQDLTCYACVKNEHKAEQQSEAQNCETRVINHQNLEGGTTEINPSNDTEEQEKGSLPNTQENLQIKDDEKLIKEEAKVTGVPEDEHQTKFPTPAIVQGKTKEILEQQTLDEDNSAVIDNDKSCRPENYLEKTANFFEIVKAADTNDKLELAPGSMAKEESEQKNYFDTSLCTADGTSIDNENSAKFRNSFNSNLSQATKLDPDGQSDMHESTNTNRCEHPVEKIPEQPYSCKKLESYFDSEAHSQTNEQFSQIKEKSNNIKYQISESDEHIQGQKVQCENQIKPEPQMEGEHRFSIPLNDKPNSVAGLTTNEVHEGVNQASGSENIEEQTTVSDKSLSGVQILLPREEIANQAKDVNIKNIKERDSNEQRMIAEPIIQNDPTRKEIVSRDTDEAIKEADTGKLETQEEEITQVGSANKDEGDEFEEINPSSSDNAVIKGSQDTDSDMKVSHKKSHGILSGVGSKVKHSISKVKKAITGKSSSHPKPISPK